MIVFLRSWGAILLILPAVLLRPALRSRLKVTRHWAHLWRGVFIAASMHLGFYSMSVMPLATVTVLFFMAPIIATLLATVFFGERVGLHRSGAILAGFVGAAVILRPGFAMIEWGLLAALGSAVLFALALSLSGSVTKADGALSGAVSASLITGVLTLPVVIPIWSLPSTGFFWLLMGVIVATGLLRFFADLSAYHFAEAGLLAPISYLRLILIAVGAYFLFDEIPDAATWTGAALIIGSSLYIARREAILNRPKTVSAPEKLP